MNQQPVTSRRLWRDPQNGKLMGVCAGMAEYLNVPVNLIRIMVVISLFIGLFFITVVVYFALGFFLDKKPLTAENAEDSPTATELLNQLEQQMQQGEQQVREIERYVTSETFSVRSRFRQL
ncbi:envelope stress response membrane protein PspC [Tatumella sp. UBA2305]|uniref:envelope stress response membrane protein PspC n=1 Tax=Tatumella sp. UBA2305 TaxID=1947647 RepID=UPI0025E10D5D|nr:envelope stress response membrane protein PspC [Tatumella sp. UBA2305]